ncbi:acyl-CoA dehydrogenase family protein [Sandaracinus amylolyticus]|uniref:acyl-CoA dehydrogenase family protein n=1 Tax=Sandaracinus amylolyticus TaxID=927083 RepID=UPI001F455F4B|nr:acyl-CoA dehydrogenase family protein [Sandaracinus amylolyticus]UJR84128.1 Hypothetical protein I5071_61990 [Sandaracinus amylolyticus]
MGDTSLDTMLATTRRFLAAEVDARAHDRAGCMPERVLEGARALGLFGLSIPERWGGLGLSLREVAAIVAEVARADRSLATTVGLHAGLGTRALIDLAPEPLQARWLPMLARGTRLASFAATEPGAGSDLASVRTTVRRTRSGLCVDGEKAYVTNAGLAGVLTVLVRDADATGRPSALVLVPRDTHGVEIGREERKMGLRASSTCTVRFDGAIVPADHRLSARGLEDAHRTLAWGRVLLSAGCLGTVRIALERTLAHASERRQFGRALIELGSVRHHVASIATAEATISALLDRACAHDADLPMHAGALKVLASELACEACDRAVQVHGALGFLEDPGVALLSRDCRVTRIFEGANDVLLVRHGTAVLAGHRLPRAHHDGALGGQLDALASRLDDAVFAARRLHGVVAIRHQTMLQALARADLWLHAASATLDAASSGDATRASVLALGARRALDRAGRALDRAEQSELYEGYEDDIVEALSREPTRVGACA